LKKSINKILDIFLEICIIYDRVNKINKKGGDKMVKEKARIVIEVSEEDYETLRQFKEITGLGWREILLGGAVFWYDKLNLDEIIQTLRQKFETLKKPEEV
jgi:hypothetical protein